MTKYEAIATAIATLEAIKQFGIGKWMFDKEEIEAFDIAIEALQAQTDGDLISRQDAIRWVKTECNPYGKPTLDFESGKRVIEHLEQMQSADRPSGEWISNHDGSWNCSECGLRVFIYAKGNYCPNCGAKMVANIT